MKKISLFALALSTSLAMFAQNNQNVTPMADKVYFGVKGGVNLAEFRVHNYPTHVGTELKTSMHGGFLVNVPVAGSFHVQPELIYSGEGSKLTETTALGTNIFTEQDLGYIALPIMLQLRAKNGFFVEVGPQPGYLIRAKKEYDNTTTKNKDMFDKFGLGLNGGIGYTSRMGLGINARYSLGLTNNLEDGGGDNSANNGPEFKNTVVQIGLHYMFGAGK